MEPKWLEALQCIETHSPEGGFTLFQTGSVQILLVNGKGCPLSECMMCKIHGSITQSLPEIAASGLLEKTKDQAFEKSTIQEWKLTDKGREAIRLHRVE